MEDSAGQHAFGLAITDFPSGQLQAPPGRKSQDLGRSA